MHLRFLFGVLFASVLAIPASPQTPVALSDAKLGSILDTTQWQTIDLPEIIFKLPIEFGRSDVRCFDYGCDGLLRSFKSKDHQLLISSGNLYIPTTNVSHLKETLVNHNGILGRVFQFSLKGEFHFRATFPSDEIGRALANLEFRSSEPYLNNLAYTVLQSVRIKKKLYGPQRMLLLKECELTTIPLPFDFEELIKKIKGKDDLVTANEIRTRRIGFEVTLERHQEILKSGAGKVVLEAIEKVAKELDQQTKVYDMFTENYTAREPEKIKKALDAATEFLTKWSCDQLWQDQVNFIKPWIPRLESRLSQIMYN